MALEIDLEGKPHSLRELDKGSGGRSLAALGQAGATVYVNDVVESRVDETVEEVRRRGGRSEGMPFDVTDWSQVQASLNETDGLDILINNAGNAGTEGFADLRPFVESQPEEWERYIRVNLYGVMNCTRAALPGMISRTEGRVVTIVSDAARYGDAYLAPYAAAKAGAAGFCRSIAREVGRYGITVNCVALGTVRTPTTTPGGDSPPDTRSDETLKRYIIRRRGEPEDAAGLVVYLASPQASWITGQTYPVNGGYTLSL